MDEQNKLTIALECTVFFQQNPFTLETADGIAMRIGRKLADIEPVLRNMTLKGFLLRDGEGSHAIYSYILPDVCVV